MMLSRSSCKTQLRNTRKKKAPRSEGSTTLVSTKTARSYRMLLKMKYSIRSNRDCPIQNSIRRSLSSKEMNSTREKK